MRKTKSQHLTAWNLLLIRYVVVGLLSLRYNVTYLYTHSITAKTVQRFVISSILDKTIVEACIKEFLLLFPGARDFILIA